MHLSSALFFSMGTVGGGASMVGLVGLICHFPQNIYFDMEMKCSVNKISAATSAPLSHKTIVKSNCLPTSRGKADIN